VRSAFLCQRKRTPSSRFARRVWRRVRRVKPFERVRQVGAADSRASNDTANRTCTTESGRHWPCRFARRNDEQRLTVEALERTMDNGRTHERRRVDVTDTSAENVVQVGAEFCDGIGQ
jgi:hypothetical protein